MYFSGLHCSNNSNNKRPGSVQTQDFRLGMHFGHYSLIIIYVYVHMIIQSKPKSQVWTILAEPLIHLIIHISMSQGSSKDRNLKVKCQGEDYNPVIDLLLPLNIFKVSTFYPGGFLRNPRKC